VTELLGGSLLVGIPIALLAGLVSFLSPCVLPLVPGYLGYVGGATGADGSPDRRRLILGVLLFILGFTVVFTLTSGAFGIIGTWLVVYRDIITRIAGIAVIALGLVFIGQFTFLQRSVRSGFLPATGLAGAPLLGVIFGVGWIPCISPTLGAILVMSMSSGSAGQGVALGIAYSLGLGLPFLLIAVGFGWAATSVAWVKRHIRAINIVGGAVLVAVGVLMVTGLWSLLMSWLGAVINVFVTPL
jgi:cytochrome c-type biogenesis protein